MKTKKFVAIFIVLVILMQICILPMPVSKALNDEDLIISAGVTITKNSTVEEISKDYGSEPKLITPSAFGGEMCTWYTGEYQNILYVETNENGVIMAAGAMSDDFQSNLYCAGDKVTSDNITEFQGTVARKGYLTDYAAGVIVYQKELLTDSIVQDYCREFVSKRESYRKYICEHAVIMLNHLLEEAGEDTRLEYNEEYFDMASKINTQMSISEYAEKNNKEQYYKQAGTDTNYLTLYRELANPMRPADVARNFYPTNTIKYAYLTYGVSESDSASLGYSGGVTSYYLAKELFEENVDVSLTAEEQEKYVQAKAMYEKSVDEFNEGTSDYFEQEPNYESLPLKAGKIKENKLQGSVDFLNAIRLGAGLNTLTLNTEASNAAQYKAVLTRYITIKGISNPDPHYPSKPDGVDDEFYNTAQTYMTENLYSGNIITSISQALHDGAGDPIKAGHRYNLLAPDRTSFGIGYVDGQSCHKLTAGGSSSVDMVAWPSIGITPMEAFEDGAYWTFKLYNSDYSIDVKTTVKVKCLNTGKEWTFNDTSTSNGNNFVRGGDILSFKSNDLVKGEGYIYEITIQNLKNDETGSYENYTYRSVFKSLTSEEENISPTSISLEPSTIQAVRGASQVIDVNFTPSNTTEIVTKWSTSNPNVATVNQYGEVTITGIGTATITAETLNGKKATCDVTGLDGISGLEFEEENYYIKETKSETLKVSEINNIPLDESKIVWTVSDPEVATIRNGVLTIEDNTVGKEFTVTAEYEGKKATCTVHVLYKINISPSFKLDSGSIKPIEKEETRVVTFLQDNSYTNIVKFECDIPYESDKLEVVEIEPLMDEITAEITEPGNIHVTFSSNEKEVIDIKRDLVNITFKAITGTYSEIKMMPANGIYYVYQSESPKQATMQYRTTITIYNEITEVTISNTTYTFDEIGKTLQLTASPNPSENIKDATITWSSDKKSVATVDKNGLVTAKGSGTATITATSVNGKTATCTVTVKQSLLKGDVNNDEKVALYDAFQILRQVILDEDALTDDETYIMDYNDDGKVALYDAFQFLRQVILS